MWIWIGMLAALAGEATSGLTVLEFDDVALQDSWVIVNDDVMGGRSTSSARITEGVLRFSGTTNTQGGGFASVRTTNREWPFDDVGGLRLRMRGDGRTYLVDIRTSDRRLAPPFRATFATIAGKWQEITIPFADLRAWNFRGPIEGPEAPAFDARAIRAVGFMIYDGKDGPFSLEVDWMRPTTP